MRQREEVYEKLAMVCDPELDQSVTDMGFIEDVGIEGSNVTIYFRLPTYWCSPNFAYIMAEDMRDRVLELPWVSQAVIALKDHCAAEEVNAGVTSGKDFAEVFTGLSGGDLAQLRQTFRIKTFVSRQERLLRYLLNKDIEPKTLVTLTLQQLETLADPSEEGKQGLERYLASRDELGFSHDPNQLAFIQSSGEPIAEYRFADYLLDARRTRMSMEFNAHHCRGLLETRYTLEMKKEREVS